MEYIKRKIEDKLIASAETFKAVLLTGAPGGQINCSEKQISRI